MAAADQVKRAAGAASADLTGEGTILLVEDEEGLRALNARGLTSRGYTVLEAGNGVEAIDVLEKSGKPVDLVVSDVVMPEMDGPTLARELRTRNPGLKIIFVSGYAEDAFQKNLPEHEKGQYRFPAKAVHAQAARRRGEGNAGGVTRAHQHASGMATRFGAWNDPGFAAHDYVALRAALRPEMRVCYCAGPSWQDCGAAGESWRQVGTSHLEQAASASANAAMARSWKLRPPKACLIVRISRKIRSPSANTSILA